MDLALGGRLLGACAVIALVLVAVNFVARRMIGPRLPARAHGRILSVLETAFLPSAASVHVVRVAERYYAIGRSGSHIATLCEIPAESLAGRHQPAGPRRPRT